MKVTTIQLPDNFVKGNCRECPFSYIEFDEDDDYLACIFGCKYNECPIEVEEVEE